MPKETLYNGITLPEVWPVQDVSMDFDTPLPVPYLHDKNDGGTHPEVVNIDVGRQLFVDDFLVAETDLTPEYHTAVDHPANPILVPGDKHFGSFLKHGSIVYDASKKVYRLWLTRDGAYVCYESLDGVTWDRNAFTTLDLEKGGYFTVLPNPNPKDDSENFVAMMRYSNGQYERMPEYTGKSHESYPVWIFKSPDGVHGWQNVGHGGHCGDATTMFYNPFRQKWVLSLRHFYKQIARARDYFECDDILTDVEQCGERQVFWQRCDKDDVREAHTPDDMRVQIYALCATAYESVMLGAYQILTGPENKACEAVGIPKVTHIHLGYSRDGFHFDRPSREPIIRSSQIKGDWKRGYVHPVGNVMVVHDDELWFYYDGFCGDEARAGDGVACSGTLDYQSVGLAKMRRDGFVSLNGSGHLTTKPITFTNNQSYLFVNADCKGLRAEILDADGHVVPGFEMDACLPFSGDKTKTQLTWRHSPSLSVLNGRPFAVRFEMEEGKLYAFWVSDTPNGDAHGRFSSNVVPSEC